jgi:hypothetical protein
MYETFLEDGRDKLLQTILFHVNFGGQPKRGPPFRLSLIRAVRSRSSACQIPNSIAIQNPPSVPTPVYKLFYGSLLSRQHKCRSDPADELAPMYRTNTAPVFHQKFTNLLKTSPITGRLPWRPYNVPARTCGESSLSISLFDAIDC